MLLAVKVALKPNVSPLKDLKSYGTLWIQRPDKVPEAEYKRNHQIRHQRYLPAQAFIINHFWWEKFQQDQKNPV